LPTSNVDLRRAPSGAGVQSGIRLAVDGGCDVRAFVSAAASLIRGAASLLIVLLLVATIMFARGGFDAYLLVGGVDPNVAF
jgi:hypothetical protein